METNERASALTDSDGRASPPRQLPTADAEVYGDDVLLEEQTLSWFHPDKWCPIRIGEVIRSRFQVLVKLGFGSVSTVWLCRDLRYAPLQKEPGKLKALIVSKETHICNTEGVRDWTPTGRQ